MKTSVIFYTLNTLRAQTNKKPQRKSKMTIINLWHESNSHKFVVYFMCMFYILFSFSARVLQSNSKCIQRTVKMIKHSTHRQKKNIENYVLNRIQSQKNKIVPKQNNCINFKCNVGVKVSESLWNPKSISMWIRFSIFYLVPKLYDCPDQMTMFYLAIDQFAKGLFVRRMMCGVGICIRIRWFQTSPHHLTI